MSETYTLDSLQKDLQEQKISYMVLPGKTGPMIELRGFSKSGTACIREEDGKLICATRYDREDTITCFDDILEVAWEWFASYQHRAPFTEPSDIWAPFFVAKGWLSLELIPTYKVTRGNV